MRKKRKRYIKTHKEEALKERISNLEKSHNLMLRRYIRLKAELKRVEIGMPKIKDIPFCLFFIFVLIAMLFWKWVGV